MTDKKKLHQILSSLWKNNDSVGKTYYNQALQDVQTAVDLQEEPMNEDLQEAAWFYADKKACLDKSIFTQKEINEKRSKLEYNWEDIRTAFKAGAKWQKLQDMGITNKAQDVVANVLSSADNPLDAYATEVAFIMLPATLKESYHQTNRDRISDAVKLGAKWQEKQDQSTIELAEDHAYFAGSEAMREKILKEIEEAYKKGGVIEAMKIIRELKSDKQII